MPSNLTFDQITSLGATVTGAGSVSYELVNAADASKVSISGGQVRALSGTGTVQVRAVTAGNDNYSGAAALQTITLAKAAQILTFGSVTPRLTGSTTFLPVSGVQVGTASFAVTETDGRATVDSLGNVTIGKIFGAQTFQLTASVAGNDNYLSKDETITVNISPDTAAIRAANPIRAATDVAGVPSKVIDALDAYFYYDTCLS